MDELKNRFYDDVARVQMFYAQLRRLVEEQCSFEERLQFLVLRFPLEQVLQMNFQTTQRGFYVYCFFVQAQSLSHVRLSRRETLLTYKIKMRIVLRREEKIQALRFLSKLARDQTLF